MKKLLLLLASTLTGYVTFGQNEYIIKYKSSLTGKEVVEILTTNRVTSNRYSMDTNTIVMSFKDVLPSGYFTQFDSSDVIILSIDIHKLLVHPLEKAGGADCEQAQLLCDNQALPANSSGSGSDVDLNSSNDGCLSGEHQSSWYYVTIQAGGTLTMTINPNTNSNDYDFAIWGAFTNTTADANCPPISGPIRCSWAAGGGNTGLGHGASDLSESATGNKWVAPLNVLSGQVYIVVVDNWSTSNSGYNLSWGGTSSLGCTPVTLPIELKSFTGYNKGVNVLEWVTGSETNNYYFTIENSTDGVSWDSLFKITGANTSTTEKSYIIKEADFRATINYYRLSQTDFNGKRVILGTVSIDNRENTLYVVKTLNLLGQEVDASTKGLVIRVYNDGTTKKIYVN